MTQATKLYPIGIQTFEKIRNGNYLYIDKTEIIYRLTHAASNYVFLSRPRRFGKSLLTSTLKAYFEGRRDLFKGLAMERLETEWTKYPVLHFDMSLGKHMEKEQLERYLLSQLEQIEEDYGIHSDSPDSNIRLTKLIRHVYEQTDRQVVRLIDDYDAPLLDVVHEEKNLPILRNIMRNFYSPLKACDPYLRFVFLTGITKFSQLSIFSELNNIKNISMLPEYAAICGITEEEIMGATVTYFGDSETDFSGGMVEPAAQSDAENAQYQDDISAINAFQRTYESEMDSVVATLEGNVSAAMPELDLSEYEVKVQLLVDAITINKQRIAAKIKEPTSIASLEDTDSLLIEIGTLIDGFNKKIKENNEIVRDLKTKKVLCKKQVWEYLAELLKADVAAYNKALSDLDTEIKALKDKM